MLYILDQTGSVAYVNIRIPGTAEICRKELYIDCVYFWCMKSWSVKLNLVTLTIHTILRRYQHISFGLYKTQLCDDVPCFRTSIKMFNNVCRFLDDAFERTFSAFASRNRKHSRSTFLEWKLKHKPPK